MSRSTREVDGRGLAAALRAEVAATLGDRDDVHPVLAVVVVGGDEAADAATARKREAGTEVGVEVSPHRLPATATEAEVEHLVGRLAADAGVHGIFVHLPLPAALDEVAVLRLVPAAKDVDGMGDGSDERLRRHGRRSAPAGAEAVLLLLEAAGVGLGGQRVRLARCPAYLEEPLAALLRREGAEVDDDGDLEIDLASPGGIGPVTVALLLERTVRAAIAGA